MLSLTEWNGSTVGCGGVISHAITTHHVSRRAGDGLTIFRAPHRYGAKPPVGGGSSTSELFCLSFTTITCLLIFDALNYKN
jgi:hypothetical protein